MNIIINGNRRQIAELSTLESALHEFQIETPFVILLNQEFVPKSQYPIWTLREDDEVEIIGAIQGG